MFSLFRRKPKTQRELVVLGDQARARGKVKKAINHYQAALALGPDDAAIHGKLAPLLAKTQQGEAALNSFKAAADGHLAKGFADRALSVWTQAAGSFPNQPRIWQEMARLQLDRGRRADALKALLDGRGALKRKDERAEAVVLLRQVLELEPGHADARIESRAAPGQARPAPRGARLARAAGVEPAEAAQARAQGAVRDCAVARAALALVSGLKSALAWV